MEINEYAKLFRLPYLKRNYKTMIEEAENKRVNFEQMLSNYFKLELEERLNNSIQRKIKDAKFS